ncbi:MAG: AAA family ATPase [Chitinophagaceae bacterium]
MKFKKVEISAFRIYDQPEDATFDFSIHEDITADFISLYAPNGYGKTSFYDAVEWGMTNNIQRFWQNKTITNGAIDALKNHSDAQVKLWRNIHSTQPTYVKIVGEGIEPIDRRLKPHGNKKSDADVDGSESLENRTFRNVILSQEWISAFLREIDGSKRYEIFMDNPELKDVNSYYKNLKALLGYCKGNISSIDQKINEEQKRISALESENVLEKINQQIDTLTEKFKQSGLNKLTLQTTKEEISRLKNLLVDRLISVNEEAAIRAKIEWVSAAKIGNDDYIGIRAYFDFEARNQIIEATQRSISAILSKFADVDKKLNEIAVLNKLLAEKETVKHVISSIVGQYDEYLRVSNLLLQNEERIGVLKAEINRKSEELSSLEIHETEAKSDLNSTLAGIAETTATIAALPERLQLMEKIEQEITAQEKEISLEKEQLKPLEVQFKIIGEEIWAVEEKWADIKQRNYSKKLLEDQVLASSIDVIMANSESLAKNDERLKSLNLRIAQQEALNSEIAAFVRRGLEILAKDQDRTSCPLCEQSFETHQELARRIANNTALDNLLKSLFADKNIVEQESSVLQELITTAAGRLLHYFEDKIKEKRALQTAVSDQIKTLSKTIALSEENLAMMRNEQRELIMQQLGLSTENYQQELSKNLEAFRKTEERLNGMLKKQAQDKKEIRDLLGKLRDELKPSTENTEILKQSEQYRAVVDWFNTNFSTEQVTFERLQNELIENHSLIKEFFDKASLLRTEVESLSLELSTFTQQGERDRLHNLTEEKERAETKMDGFRRLLKDKLEVESQFIDLKTLAATLDLKEQGFNFALLNNKALIDEYNRIDRYADHINEFLQSENAKLALDKLAADKAFLEQNVRSLLSDELGKTKAFLQEKVKEFFYESLINDLYRKLDPHPDFKEVHFSADFDAETPRLDVFVRDKVYQKVDLIPNLYFSTAQINILSLSIFLASALNTPGYDCIFIDDPIQSLDSVNVLSTIDLLRSIVLNYNKQIILSTHDETFFNLLKKKMPMGPFKSKFLELESVGKVKNDK